MPEHVVVVLGDLGRSPRMMNHAVSLMKLPDAVVHLVGYTETPLIAELQEAKNVKVHRIKQFMKMPRYLFPVYAPMKIFWLLLQLFTLFFRIPRFDTIIAQNPPSMPTIPFCWLLRKLRGKRFVIDWHNLGYSILRCGGTSPLIVKIARVLEYFFGKFSDANICVTKAFKQHLHENGIEAEVMYDRPPDIFKPCPESREKVLNHLGVEGDPIMVVTSTSWTPDEDISMLLDAADELENHILPGTGKEVLFIITGKGDQRRWFETELLGRNYQHVDFKLDFFSYSDYAELLGTCDLGVSLHISSSGLDLPMKGLDMLGAGLPVLSVQYPCIGELVVEGENGLLFNDGVDLASLIDKLFIKKDISYENIKKGALRDSEKRWNAEWAASAQPVILGSK